MGVWREADRDCRVCGHVVHRGGASARLAGETVEFFLPGEHTRLGVMAFNNVHEFEHYGNIVTYNAPEGHGSALLGQVARDTPVPPVMLATALLAGAVSPASTLVPNQTSLAHVPERGARLARRDDRAYREYSREEQRRHPACPAIFV